MLTHLNAIPTEPSRVVVIGAGGFIGRTVVNRLTATGVSVLALTRRELDLSSVDAADKLKRLLAPNDAVVMIAAVAPAKNGAMVMTNLRLLEPVCEALDAVTPAHVAYVSSDAVYADDSHPVTEGSYTAPSTLHGVMHFAREQLLRTASAAPFVAIRPTLVYGPGDPHNGYGPNRFRRQAARGESITIFGEGEERRDHVFVEDVAQIVRLCVAHRSIGAINAATGRSVAFAEIAALVAQQFSRTVPIVSLPRAGPRPHLLHRFFDVTERLKAFPAFSYTPLEHGLMLCMQDV